MKDYYIGGIQQVGIGVENLYEAWNWYSEYFGMDCKIFEDEAVAKLMLPYTGGQPRSRHAILALNLQSGGGFEIWQHTGRRPVRKEEELRLGDLGIIACKMKVKNITDAFRFYRERIITMSEKILEDPSGDKHFFIKDPYGNLFQMVESNGWFMNENKISGGSYGVIIGVTDIDKASPLYSEILGFDNVVYDRTEVFPDFSGIPGGEKVMRRVLLKRTEPLRGPFSKVLGNSQIELLSTEKPGNKIYEDRFWGDPGFIHLCFDIGNMDNLKSYCAEKGFPFSVDSKESHEGTSFDMGEAAGHFAYIEDTDGTLIEFVETHKVPIIKKIGWYLDLKKRDPGKSLPDWILRALKFSKVKSKQQ